MGLTYEGREISAMLPNVRSDVSKRGKEVRTGIRFRKLRLFPHVELGES